MKVLKVTGVLLSTSLIYTSVNISDSLLEIKIVEWFCRLYLINNISKTSFQIHLQKNYVCFYYSEDLWKNCLCKIVLRLTTLIITPSILCLSISSSKITSFIVKNINIDVKNSSMFQYKYTIIPLLSLAQKR